MRHHLIQQLLIKVAHHAVAGLCRPFSDGNFHTSPCAMHAAIRGSNSALQNSYSLETTEDGQGFRMGKQIWLGNKCTEPPPDAALAPAGCRSITHITTRIAATTAFPLLSCSGWFSSSNEVRLYLLRKIINGISAERSAFHGYYASSILTLSSVLLSFILLVGIFRLHTYASIDKPMWLFSMESPAAAVACSGLEADMQVRW